MAFGGASCTLTASGGRPDPSGNRLTKNLAAMVSTAVVGTTFAAPAAKAINKQKSRPVTLQTKMVSEPVKRDRGVDWSLFFTRLRAV